MEKSIGRVTVEQIVFSNNAMSPMAMGFDPGTSRIVHHRSFNWAKNRVVIFNLKLSCFRNTTDTIVSNTKHRYNRQYLRYNIIWGIVFPENF